MSLPSRLSKAHSVVSLLTVCGSFCQSERTLTTDWEHATMSSMCHVPSHIFCPFLKQDPILYDHSCRSRERYESPPHTNNQSPRVCDCSVWCSQTCRHALASSCLRHCACSRSPSTTTNNHSASATMVETSLLDNNDNTKE